MSTAAHAKDVIYIDVDDEITSIIDKVQASKSKIVALVLPKRAAVLQSVVNMKLLKRSADEVKKNVVLITADPNLLPLAGNIGLHVSKSLQTKPEVPDVAEAAAKDDEDEIDSVADDADDSDAVADTPIDKTKAVGELASSAALMDDLDDTIELGDEDDAADGDGPEPGDDAADGKKAKKPKDKAFKIPNFNRFRLVMLLIVPLLIVLLVGGVVAAKVLPKAKVDIKTDSQSIDSSMVLALKTDPGTKLDPVSATVPATQQSEQKTLSQQVPTTGKQNNGTKATGSVAMSAGACSANVPNDVPAGTALSASSLTFITQANTTFVPVIAHGKCTYQSSGSTAVTAQTGGSQYNIGASSFAVSGRSDVSASSSAAMSGGTDNVVSVVVQADIDSATQKIGTQDTASIKTDLQNGLIAKGLYPVVETFNTGAPQTKTSANLGDQADSVTVNETISYTMLGVSQSDLQKLVAADVDKKIDTSKQSILDYGLGNAVFGLQNQVADGANVTFQTTVVAGSDLNVAQIKSQIAGKKAGDAEAVIKQYPGVTSVNVSYSPFWVSAIPKSTAKITVTVEKPKAPAKTSSNASANP
ncbi:MAG TPA: hypothetical protein VLF91_04890 [Candidatus Saccharimonadales bacterium]|nr:hypothetical protein [Candidatus Saccharimonadales bacterium]